MTREELTNEIYKRLVEIQQMYAKENPQGKYLSFAILEDAIMFNNESWKNGADENYPISFYRYTGEREQWKDI